MVGGLTSLPGVKHMVDPLYKDADRRKERTCTVCKINVEMKRIGKKERGHSLSSFPQAVSSLYSSLFTLEEIRETPPQDVGQLITDFSLFTSSLRLISFLVADKISNLCGQYNVLCKSLTPFIVQQVTRERVKGKE